jgi:hypothetical protein
MPTNDDDSDSEHFPDIHHDEGAVRGAGLLPVNNNATVHELDQIKTKALRDIDDGGFSCVTSPPLSSACSQCLKLLSY